MTDKQLDRNVVICDVLGSEDERWAYREGILAALRTVKNCDDPIAALELLYSLSGEILGLPPTGEPLYDPAPKE